MACIKTKDNNNKKIQLTSQACIKKKKRARSQIVRSVFFQCLICFLSIHGFSSWPCIDLKNTEVNGTNLTGGKVKLSEGEFNVYLHHSAPGPVSSTS